MSTHMNPVYRPASSQAALVVRRSAAVGMLTFALAAAASSGAYAQSKTPDPAKARYEQDRAACMNGTSQEDKATCLKESGAVLQERKEGKIEATPRDAATLQENALQRCVNLPAKDKADCEVRAKGGGTREGSVAGGGVIKETVTTKVLPRGATVPPDSVQIGTIPAAVIPPPPNFASSPSQ